MCPSCRVASRAVVESSKVSAAAGMLLLLYFEKTELPEFMMITSGRKQYSLSCCVTFCVYRLCECLFNCINVGLSMYEEGQQVSHKLTWHRRKMQYVAFKDGVMRLQHPVNMINLLSRRWLYQ